MGVLSPELQKLTGYSNKPWNVAPSFAYASSGPMGAANEMRKRENTMFGRQSTILTSGMGAVGDPNIRVHSLLGS